MNFSVGVCAFNEAKNISRILDALLKQKPSEHAMTEVIVISSGSTDGTDEIVTDFSKKHPQVKLITEPERKGKASAINIFLKNASGEVLVLESADTMPLENTLEELLKPFSDEKVGMVGGRPIPLNDENSFVGFTVNFIWKLHHEISLKKPKTGEIVAFRNIIKEVSTETSVDEAWIESYITSKGYAIKYAPNAVVRNRGPETIADLIRQRKRIHIGHLHLKETRLYSTVTLQKRSVLNTLLNNIDFRPKQFVWTLGAVLLELYIRLLANIDFYVLKKNPYRWDIASTTKDLR